MATLRPQPLGHLLESGLQLETDKGAWVRVGRGSTAGVGCQGTKGRLGPPHLTPHLPSWLWAGSALGHPKCPHI